MNLNKLKNIINSLASSQGFYGRLKNDLDTNNKRQEFLKIINKNNIKDGVDLVLFLEC